MKNWKNYFEHRILDRGYDYFLEDLVENIQRRGNIITADVYGTNIYSVEIKDEGDELYMTCDCPYAEDGSYCKHMAAVLFAVHKAPQTVSVSETDDGGIAWQDALAALSEEKLRSLLNMLALDSPELQHTILMAYTENPVTDLRKQWNRKLDQIKSRCGGYRGYMDYYFAEVYANELDEYMCEQLVQLKGLGFFSEAFDLICTVFEEAVSQDMDDSDGGLAMLCSSCSEQWEQLIPLATAEQQAEMYEWFRNFSPDSDYDYCEDIIQTILYSPVWQGEQLLSGLRLLDEEIAAIDTDNMTWRTECKLENFIEKRMDIMLRLGYDHGDAEEYLRKYYSLPRARQLMTDLLLADNKTEKAIALLRESKEIDSDRIGLVASYSEKLMEIFEQSQHEDAYYEELMFYALSCPQRDLKYAELLKEKTPEKEWVALRRKLLESPSMRFHRNDLLASEEMYAELLESVANMGRFSVISELDRYESVLSKHYPEKVRDRYAEYIVSEMRTASQRSTYHHLAGYLKKLCSYPGGEELAKQIAADWRKDYPRRRAMLDEITKAGF